MAELNKLSAMLEGFNNSYDSVVEAGSKASTIADSINQVSTKVSSAISNLATASSDAQVTSASGGLQLAKDGLDRVKSHVEGDLGALMSNAGEVKSIIDQILQKIEDGKSWTPGGKEKNATTGEEEYVAHDQAKINAANAEIDYLNQKGEAQLNAMSSAINSVAFGVAGNMQIGGTLGNSTTYPDNYNFTFADFEVPPEDDGSGDNNGDNTQETEDLNFIEGVGAVVGGVASAPFKVVEGILDVGTFLLGGIVSIFDRKAADSIYEFASKDLVDSAQTAILGEKITNSGLYKGAQEVGKMATYVVGNCVAPPVGQILTHVGMAGNAMENIYAQTGRGDVTLLSGTAIYAVSNGLWNYGENAAHRIIPRVVAEVASYAVPEVITTTNDPGDNNRLNSKKEDK